MSDAAPATEPFHAVTLAASLTVDDLPASLAWYRDALGFVAEREHERDGKVMSVSIRAGDVRLLLNQDDGAKGWERTKGEGLSLHLTTKQDVDALAARAREAGAEIVTEPVDVPWGARVFRVVDPDGFQIAVSTVPPDR